MSRLPRHDHAENSQGRGRMRCRKNHTRKPAETPEKLKVSRYFTLLLNSYSEKPCPAGPVRTVSGRAGKSWTGKSNAGKTGKSWTDPAGKIWTVKNRRTDPADRLQLSRKRKNFSERLRHDHKGKSSEFRKIDAAGTRAKRPHAAGCVYKPVTASHGPGIQRYYHDRKIAL